MPHKCTRCEHIFEDGAEVILSGCPNCGWNKFLYVQGKDASSQDEVPQDKEDDVVVESAESEPSENLIKEVDEVLGVQEKQPSLMEDGERVESVRILGPGSYELNLDSLLERKELVMAIKGEGTYALHLPSVFNKDKKEEDSD